jgi:hypothetical protein
MFKAKQRHLDCHRLPRKPPLVTLVDGSTFIMCSLKVVGDRNS